MITESVADPRRANWLTISMSEDLCWPEENGTNRPSWELEAEILRLTTRLMMREKELRQVKSQLKSQAHWAEQQVANWRRKMTEKEKQMQLLLVQKDSEMQTIVSQLILFEAELIQEQNKIEGLLKEKNSTISKQQEEIRQLRSMVNKNTSNVAAKQMNTILSCEDRTLVTSNGKNECDSSEHNYVLDFMTPQTPAKNTESTCNIIDKKSSTDFTLPSSRSLSSNVLNCHSNNTSSVPLDCRSPSPMPNRKLDRKGACTILTVNSESRVPYLLCKGQSEYKVSPISCNLDAKIPSHANNDSDAAVKKIKDSLLRIRAIQDLTNVRSRSEKTLIPENMLGEKRRLTSKTPQKMKDLKAKRINMQHRNHRPELCGQVIL